MMRVLLTGATGQVGWELARALAPLGPTRVMRRADLDLSQPQAMHGAIDAFKPDLIVNAAAYTGVDKAEEDTAGAMAVNAEAPGELAQAARRHGALFVHYSTDYVFDGRKDGAYLETDAPSPAGAYGRSKLAGEQAVQASGADYLIFRTSWVYAARGKNFLRTILRLAAEREQLRVVADQVGAPTWARLIAETTALAVQHDMAERRASAFRSALLHLTASGSVSWHGFASAIVTGARARGAPIKCAEIVPIATSDYPLPAPRPANSALEGDKMQTRYGFAMPDWKQSLALCLDELFEAGAAQTTQR